MDGMQLSGSDFYLAYRPSPCDLRLFLHFKGTAVAKPSAFEEVTRRLGERHEKTHLATLENVTDLSDGKLEERQKRTLEAIRANILKYNEEDLGATWAVLSWLRGLGRHQQPSAIPT